jgi:DNA gyrase/topoisomerase IV subunit A
MLSEEQPLRFLPSRFFLSSSPFRNLKMKPLCFVETSGTNDAVMRRHMPEERRQKLTLVYKKKQFIARKPLCFLETSGTNDAVPRRHMPEERRQKVTLVYKKNEFIARKPLCFVETSGTNDAVTRCHMTEARRQKVSNTCLQEGVCRWL